MFICLDDKEYLLVFNLPWFNLCSSSMTMAAGNHCFWVTDVYDSINVVANVVKCWYSLLCSYDTPFTSNPSHLQVDAYCLFLDKVVAYFSLTYMTHDKSTFLCIKKKGKTHVFISGKWSLWYFENCLQFFFFFIYQAMPGELLGLGVKKLSYKIHRGNWNKTWLQASDC